LLYQFLGPSVFAGFGVMVLLIPFNVLAAGKGKKYQVRGGEGGGVVEGGEKYQVRGGEGRDRETHHTV
jgi:hypothetical protein